MDCPENPVPLLPPPVEAGGFTWKGFVFSMLAAPALGLVGAWVGRVAQDYFAPFLLFPVLLGVFSGMAIVGLVRLAQIGNRPTIVWAAVLAAAVTAVGEHYFTYLAAYHRPTIAVGSTFDGWARPLRPGPGDGRQASPGMCRRRPIAAGRCLSAFWHAAGPRG